MECKGCNYEDCDCQEFKQKLEDLVEEIASLSLSLKLNVNISVNDGKVKCITWYRDAFGNVQENEFFRVED